MIITKLTMTMQPLMTLNSTKSNNELHLNNIRININNNNIINLVH